MIRPGGAECADDFRDQPQAGDEQAAQSDRQIESFLVARYGVVILMKPPVQPDTWLLWLAPFLVLGLGGGVAWIVVKKAAATDAY